MSLISNLSDGKAQQMPYRDISTIHRSYGPCIDQVRMDHDHTDNCAQENISAKYPCRRYCDKDRQECKCRVCKKIQDAVPVTSCKCRHSLAKCLHKSHHQTGCHDCRKDRNKHISQCLDHPFKYRLLRCSRSLHFFLGSGCHSADLKELLINFIDCSCSDDKLKLSVIAENALHSIDILQLLHVDLTVVHSYQTEPGSTVCCADQIGPAAQCLIDFFRTYCIIQSHFFFLPFLFLFM